MISLQPDPPSNGHYADADMLNIDIPHQIQPSLLASPSLATWLSPPGYLALVCSYL